MVTSSRIENAFRDAQGGSPGRVLPYFTGGFPDLETTGMLIRQADAVGAAALEIGIPYSDSIADGPVIQDSFNEVLQHGQRLADVFSLVKRLRRDVRCGLIAMVSYAIVYKHEVDSFMDGAATVGFDGVIIPDLPVEESKRVFASADRAGLCHIGLVAPTTSPARRERIAKASSGFIYMVAVSGTTGERQGLRRGLAEDVNALRAVSGLPVCAGFGISTPAQVQAVCRVADGAIVGSAVVRRIRQCYASGSTGSALVARVSDFLSQLIGRETT